MKIVAKTAADTFAAGQELAKQLHGGETILLTGDLGAGKTIFVQGLASGLGLTRLITSPTFVLFKPYAVKHSTITRFIHADLYRLPDQVDATALGLNDYCGQPHTVVAIEWAEKLAHQPPGKVVTVTIALRDNSRTITIA
ncbi:MAG: tRNA (adenosine(37)-N6)-threonylcarbamoyltransferase complex ATPase subunit type 1 TsaE [Patescibacteria group bacterium]